MSNLKSNPWASVNSASQLPSNTSKCLDNMDNHDKRGMIAKQAKAEIRGLAFLDRILVAQFYLFLVVHFLYFFRQHTPPTLDFILLIASFYINGRYLFVRTFGSIGGPKLVKTVIQTFCGILCTSFCLLFLGHLGIQLEFYAIFLTNLFLSITGLFFATEPEGSSEDGTMYTELTFLALSLPLFILLFAKIVYFAKVFSPAWDHFTFWWIAPKKLFLSGYFPTNLDGGHLSVPYSHFHVLPSFLTFFYLEGVYDQLLPIFTIFYAVLTHCFVYRLFFKEHPLLRAIAILTVFSFFYTTSEFLHLSYADIANSSFVLMICCFLFREKKTQKNFLFLVLTCLGFILIKPTNRYYLFVIICVYCLSCLLAGYKLKNFICSVKKHKISLLIALGLVFSKIVYDNYFYVQNSPLGPFQYGISRWNLAILPDLFKIIYEDNHFHILFLTTLGIVGLLKFRHWAFFLFLVLPVLNIFHYILVDAPLVSRSISRYATISFLLPILCLSLKTCAPRVPRKFLAFLMSSFFVFSTYLSLGFFWSNPELMSKPIHNFQFRPASISKYAKNIREHLNETDSIMIISSNKTRAVVGTNVANLVSYELAEFKFAPFFGNGNMDSVRSWVREYRLNKIILQNPSKELRKLAKEVGTLQAKFRVGSMAVRVFSVDEPDS